jgi:beta-glucosidase/6-phospho-beta-glucosidase/beta-galactosidase
VSIKQEKVAIEYTKILANPQQVNIVLHVNVKSLCFYHNLIRSIYVVDKEISKMVTL